MEITPNLERLKKASAAKLNATTVLSSVVEPEPVKQEEPEERLLVIRTANQRLEDASKLPIQKKLFGEFWHEGELCILFADTGAGKSILAVQACDSISRGDKAHGLEILECCATGQTVLYLDCELNDKQFRLRYAMEDREKGEFFSDYNFDGRFKNATLEQDLQFKGIETEQEYEDRLNAQIEEEVKALGAKVLVVDNITYLKSETDKGKNAHTFMKYLKRLKERNNISILALAHTPKRDDRQPISLNDLAGSKMLSNFADSIFAIGKSAKSNDTRYIKQLKYRNGAMPYDSENVIVCRIEKPYNFTQMTFTGFGKEGEHLFKAQNVPIEEMQGAKGDAVRFIKEALKNGAIESIVLSNSAQEEGISDATFRRARKEYCINYQKDGRHYTDLKPEEKAKGKEEEEKAF